MNTIIGAIGCITGSISLIMLIKQNKFSKGKLLVEKSDRSNTCYFNAKEFNVIKYQTDYSAFVSLKITNKSAYPITIDEIAITNGKEKAIHAPDFECRLFMLEGTTMSEYPVSPACLIPQKFEPFETKYISARFPLFSSFLDKANSPITATVEIVSSRCKAYLMVEIPNIHSMAK